MLKKLGGGSNLEGERAKARRNEEASKKRGQRGSYQAMKLRGKNSHY